MNLTRFVLDTDILSLYRRGETQVCQNVASRLPQCIHTTIISFEEQMTSWYTLVRRAKNDAALVSAYDNMTRTLQFYLGVKVLPYTTGAAARFSALRSNRIRIGTKDLRIACIALDSSAILVTRNRQDFSQIPGLQIEDWSQP